MEKKASFSSRIGFVLAAAGAAVQLSILQKELLQVHYMTVISGTSTLTSFL